MLLKKTSLILRPYFWGLEFWGKMKMGVNYPPNLFDMSTIPFPVLPFSAVLLPWLPAPLPLITVDAAKADSADDPPKLLVMISAPVFG